jgi:transcription antitermination factor NusG
LDRNGTADLKSWFVMRTKPRNEFKVHDQITNKEIEVYLPKIERLRIWSDRKKKIFVPLFPSYLFIHGNNTERLKAISNTIGAMGYLMYRKRPAIVTEKEIENIKISLIEPERIKVEEIRITNGDLVEITYGPFTGLTGIIIEIRGSYKLVVNITELSASLNIELNASEVKLLSKVKK